MTLEQLRIFVAVAERQHVTQAARDLHLTQSAVSGALASLESQHRVRLFDRVGRGVRLNQAGETFLAEARAVLGRAAAAEMALDDLSSLRRGRLAIGATPTIANYWLPRRLVAFRAAYPAVAVEVLAGDTQVVTQAVLDGVVELGFVGALRREPGLPAEVVGRDQLVLLAPPGHPWARLEPITAEDLRTASWVLREPGSGTRSNLEKGLRAYGVGEGELQAALTLPSNEAVLGAVEAGGGVTALSESVALAAVEAGRVVRAPLALPGRDYFLIRHGEGYASRAAKAFLQGLDGTEGAAAP